MFSWKSRKISCLFCHVVELIIVTLVMCTLMATSLKQLEHTAQRTYLPKSRKKVCFNEEKALDL